MLDEIDSFLSSIDGESSSPVQGIQKSGLDEFYEKLSKYVNMDELKGILEAKGSMLTISGAGAGKTTTLIAKLIKGLVSGEYMRETVVNTNFGVSKVMVPKRILVSTFLRTGAEELRKSFDKWVYKLGLTGISSDSIVFSTLHAEFFHVLKDMGIPVTLMENSNSLLKKVLMQHHVHSLTSSSFMLTADEMRDLECMVTYARNRVDESRFQHPLVSEYANVDSISFPLILEDFKTMRHSVKNQMDFEDLQELLYTFAPKNENIRKFLSSRYDVIMLDEFQDTSQIQYEVLKSYISPTTTVLAFGDDDQTIYSWRGSDNNIINHRFEEDYKPNVAFLSTNYRCKSNILNFVVPCITQNKNRHTKRLCSAHEGGEVVIRRDNNPDVLLSQMKEDIRNGRSIGVLSRTNFDLLIPAMLLEMDETIDFAISKSVSLSSTIPNQTFGLMMLVLNRYSQNFEDMFKLFLPYRCQGEARKLASILKVNTKFSIFTVPEEDLECSTPTLCPVVVELRKIYKELGEIPAYLYLLKVLRTYTYAGKSTFAAKARTFISFIESIVQHSKFCEGLTLEELHELFTSVIPNRFNRRKQKVVNSNGVKITTVHEAKGKEWDSVYIWNAVNGVFPGSVGGRDLSDEEYEEERRIFYIACTRAKDKLTIFTSLSNSSEFLKECDMSYVGKKPDDTVKQVDYAKSSLVVKGYTDIQRIVESFVSSALKDSDNYQVQDAINICLNEYTLSDLQRKIFQYVIENMVTSRLTESSVLEMCNTAVLLFADAVMEDSDDEDLY